MGKRTVIDASMIEKINKLYIQLGTYAAVARELGISASTVSKYVKKGYIFNDKVNENIRSFDKSLLTSARGHTFVSCDMSEDLILSEEEFEEIKELWKELNF